MNMIPVSSSNIIAIGYDAQRNVLRIQFLKATYDYYNIPISVYQGLMSSGSKGRYHATFIKNSYPFQQIQ